MNFSRLVTRSVIASIIGAASVAQTNASHGLVVTPTALSECASGYLCVWSGANYSGSIQRISTTNSYRPISLTATKSYYNNRAKRTWLHEKQDGSGSTVCIKPGAKKATTTGWQTTSKAVYLATITDC
ncbi:peptidase inhibitor family I36 protein [Aeromicrobium sp. UC242_57]|uniref:peptidase inhibitor family I36 protein n=1 Tax=Aeromicrobium sp. UC242_57 TaxID=3374624 RepID=UPI003796342E